MRLSFSEKLAKDKLPLPSKNKCRERSENEKDTKNFSNNVDSSIYLPRNRKQHLRHLMAAKLEMDFKSNVHVHGDTGESQEITVNSPGNKVESWERLKLCRNWLCFRGNFNKSSPIRKLNGSLFHLNEECRGWVAGIK